MSGEEIRILCRRNLMGEKSWKILNFVAKTRNEQCYLRYRSHFSFLIVSKGFCRGFHYLSVHTRRAEHLPFCCCGSKISPFSTPFQKKFFEKASNFKFIRSETEVAVKKHYLYWFSHKLASGAPIYVDFFTHNVSTSFGPQK